MTRTDRNTTWIRKNVTGAALAILASAATTVLMLAAIPAQAQTFDVLHTFAGEEDGGCPDAGLTPAKAGTFYGTTSCGNGTIFKLQHVNNDWVLTTLVQFNGINGHSPHELTMGPDGALYGQTEYGGQHGYGNVFRFVPPGALCSKVPCPALTILYDLMGGGDGDTPIGNIILDRSGNVYATASYTYDMFGAGVAYQLTPTKTGWQQNIMHTFTGKDGLYPYGGLIFDAAGNMYGLASSGGDSGYGAVYELTRSQSGWTQTVLYSFNRYVDGAYGFANLIFDKSGNLYGTNAYGGPDDAGTVFELSPINGKWTLTRLYTFSGPSGGGSFSALVQDASGNLYGTAQVDGAYLKGSVFKLTPSNGTWIYTSLHDFTGGDDGAEPSSTLVFDAQGNLYGTNYSGAANNRGVVFQIMP